ncbi:YicC/YloC family endoribonuclease [Thalassoroseus pseudoceratinae]|uniref:YicC/YloC family endoribonuclease n=1 Tax=Thalassoroseus pseudoceratinae TaxID=2713176 RepID=UPI001422565E|nr:YicC/YloC family endoribonuclease [Thalassoroseus pseudoceratinae]
MTGFGDARRETERFVIASEVRTVNNRYLKVMVRCSDGYSTLEPRIEKLVRETVSRGTVNVSLRVDSLRKRDRFRVSREMLEDYTQQLESISVESRLAAPTEMFQLLSLPGVIQESESETGNPEEDWPEIEAVLREAIERLHDFRVTEGRSMQEELVLNLGQVEEQLVRVIDLTPEVVVGLRDRLLERVRELLENTDVSVDASDVIREISIYTERADINEETTRLRSHLEQFRNYLAAEQSNGRKLDFLTQEMFREINTIGSKANNVSIAHCVVEMKAVVEKIREILQNVE